MSYHSRSSSEIETTTLSDVLPKFLKNFKQDFSFHDLQNGLKYLFNKDEMELIVSQPNEKKQNLQLFWILGENESKIELFLQTIQLWYPWLSEQVFEERRINISKDTERYINAKRTLRSLFQKHSDLNVHRMGYYCQIRKELNKLQPNNYLVVSGELGVGKKWLVVDVCTEYDIMKAMAFNIFWLDLQNCVSKEDDFRALQKLLLLIAEDDSVREWRPSSELSEFDGIDNKIIYMQRCIRDSLKQDKFKDCLLVLSDVQNSKVLKTFNLGCKILIITRNRRIVETLSTSTTTHIYIDRGLTSSECTQLFEKILKCKSSTFHEDFNDIFIQSGGQPYLLNIIANNIALNKKKNWTDWIKNLQNLQINDDKFTLIVEMSLKVLQSNEMNLYKTLTIFPHSVKIPLGLLAVLWDKSEHDAGVILSRFDKYSIVNKEHLPEGGVTCSLPYIYSSYLKADQIIDRVNLHKKVVEYYRINEALENRKEIYLVSPNSDYYFYHCIGYHLRESGFLDLFPKLFLDFGFLERKLRFDGLPNTVGSLKYFQKEITNNDEYKTELLSKLMDFLPSIEEMIFRSKDTCLLQYALMADGIIYEEAVKQAIIFTDQIWFSEKGRFHQRRQMVCLLNEPKLIIIPEPDICVISLDNNDILLIDISLDYNNKPVYLTDNPNPITKMELILKDNFIITLDKVGNLKVWSISDDRRRSAICKRNSRTKVNPLNLTQCPEMFKRKWKQLFKKNCRGAVHTFHVEKLCDGNTDLHVAFANGDVCVYQWNTEVEQFEFKSVPILPTSIKDIWYLSKILDKYYMIVSDSGQINFYNLRDSSKRSHLWPKLENLIYIGEHLRKSVLQVFFVCRKKIVLLQLPEQKFEFIMGDFETVYDISSIDSKNLFTCAQLSRDGRFLVLGTKHGLIVYDTNQNLEVLRGNISESITCVDIFQLDDAVYKYIIVCGSEKSKVLNLFALRQLDNNVIAWSHRLSTITNAEIGVETNNPKFEPDVWLQGGKLFDLNYNDSVLMVAVDSKNRIHQLCTTNTKEWSISPETSSKITAIAACNHISLCAYEGGAIFNITNENFEPSFKDKSITFLQLISENILVASSKQLKQSIVRRFGSSENIVEKQLEMDIFKCFTIADLYLILVDPKCRFLVLDLQNDFNLIENENYKSDVLRYGFEVLGGCDFKNNYLVLATVNFDIFVYKFNIDHNNLVIDQHVHYKTCNNSQKADEVTCITSSFDSSLFAVGLKSGTLELYQMKRTTLQFIFRLLSHTSKIYDLKFSPNTEVLVSCSEQLCFWHVPYMLNNPFDSGTKQKRRSSRFKSSRLDEITSAIPGLDLPTCDEGFILDNPWSNKRGSINKPELLSCIKFVGTKAEKFYVNDDFTQFNTIDNEGVYYHLSVHDISRRINISNGNSHLFNSEEDDEVIT